MFETLTTIVAFMLVFVASAGPRSQSDQNRYLDAVRWLRPMRTPAVDCSPTKEISAEDVVEESVRLRRQRFVIQTRKKLVRLEMPPEYGPPPKPVEASYLIVRRNRRIVGKFDAGIHSPLGDRVKSGFFSLLNNRKDQLIVSQDSFRPGVQWIADFSQGFKIIFDGMKFQVGREASDLTISDLDGDGTYELLVPITAFYGFEGWRLSSAETPLPEIIFKYDPHKREYLPANPSFRGCLLKEIDNTAARVRSAGNAQRLGDVMSVTLDYVFAGAEQRAWQFFEENCKLSDKEKIRQDMRNGLVHHPVYRYLKASGGGEDTLDMQYRKQD